MTRVRSRREDEVQDLQGMGLHGSLRSALLALKWEIAALRVLHAARKVAVLLGKAGFNPDQPRDDQGRWTDTDAGDGVDDAAYDPRLILIGGPDGGRGRSIDLLDEEVAGGHTVEQHIGKSEEHLLARVRGEQGQYGIFTVSRKRAGSFPSVEAANKLVNATLAANEEAVTAVADGRRAGAFVTSVLGSATGMEAYARTPRSEPYIRSTYGVGVLIAHDPGTRNGFRVITAYPRNE